MEAYEIVRLFVNKTLISKEARRRGNPGYPRLQAIRLLVYARLKRIGTDKGLIRHLKKNRRAVRGLRLSQIPHRTTVGRWWTRYSELLKEVFEELARLLQHPLPCNLLVVDSTPLEDRRDPEARWGYTSRGPFLGFKRARYTIHSGLAPPQNPTSVHFWEVSTQGRNTQTMSWTPRIDAYWIVFMNADGSAGVDVRVGVGAEVPILSTIAVVYLLGGVLLLIIGIIFLYLRIKRPS